MMVMDIPNTARPRDALTWSWTAMILCPKLIQGQKKSVTASVLTRTVTAWLTVTIRIVLKAARETGRPYSIFITTISKMA